MESVVRIRSKGGWRRGASWEGEGEEEREWVMGEVVQDQEEGGENQSSARASRIGAESAVERFEERLE